MFLQPETLAELGAREFAYSQSFTLAAAVGGVPTSVGSGSIPIQGENPFLTSALYLTFPTVYDNGGTVTDDGVSRLTLSLKANSALELFNNPANVALLGVPGRQTVQGAVDPVGGAPVPGSAPHIPGFPWYAFLPPGSQFMHQFYNSANVVAVVDVLWKGWNLDPRVDSLEKFWAIVKRCQRGPVTL